MTRTPEELIEELTQGLTPVRRAHLLPLLGMWILVATCALVLSFLMGFSLRSNAMPGLDSIGLATAAIIFGALTLVLAFPGRAIPKPWIGLAFALLIAIFLRTVWVAQEGLVSSDLRYWEDGMNPAGFACSRALVALSLLPATVLLLLVRRLAPVQELWTAAGIALSSGTLGVLVLGLHCPAENALHTLIWHWLPLVFLTFAWTLIGRRALDWNPSHRSGST